MTSEEKKIEIEKVTANWKGWLDKRLTLWEGCDLPGLVEEYTVVAAMGLQEAINNINNS